MVQKTRAKLLARVRRLKGQVEAVERALEADMDSSEVLMLLAAVRGAASGVTAEVIGQRIRRGVTGDGSEEERARDADDLIEVIRTYLR